MDDKIREMIRRRPVFFDRDHTPVGCYWYDTSMKYLWYRKHSHFLGVVDKDVIAIVEENIMRGQNEEFGAF